MLLMTIMVIVLQVILQIPAEDILNTTCEVTNRKSDTIVNCNFNHLTTVPSELPENTTHLLLNHNDMSGILPEKAFISLVNLRHLELAHNKISGIGMTSLDGLHSLEFLDLNYNDLCPDFQSFPEGSLSHVPGLKVLKFVTFGCNRKPTRDDYLANLVNLEELYLTGTNLYFGESFRLLVNLTKLDISQNIGNPIYFTNDTFKVFSDSNVTELNLRNLKIINMSSDTLSHFSHLEILNIACNTDLGLQTISSVLRHLQTRSLETLILDSVQDTKPSGSAIDYDTFCSPALKPVKKLTLRANGITSLDGNIFNLSCLHSLEYIAIGYNPILLLPMQ